MVVIDRDQIARTSDEKETEKELGLNGQVVVSPQESHGKDHLLSTTYHRSLVYSGPRDLWYFRCGRKVGNAQVAVADLEVAKQSGAKQCKDCFTTEDRTCKICERKKPCLDFTMWRLHHSTSQNFRETCNSCLEAKVQCTNCFYQPCRICQQKKPCLDFTMWQMKNGIGKDSVETCNSCMEAKESLHQCVRIFCPQCHVGKDVRLSLFWERQGANRFKKVSCKSYHHRDRLDKWLRRPHDVDNTIRAWLAHNDALEKDLCPDTKTVELYKLQIVPEVERREFYPRGGQRRKSNR